MSRKALLALCVILLVPLVFFSVTDYESKGALAMPPRFYVDTVISTIENGKQITDTVWHKVSNIEFQNQLGNTVSLDELKGKVIVADFFFTHCPGICPTLTRNMKKLQDAIRFKDERSGVDTPFVQFLSFTVDPDRDSSAALKKYADKYGANPDLWWFLTGPKKKIYDFAISELKLGISDGEGVDSNFIHTQKMVLLDKDRVVRGYYDGLDSTQLSKMAADIVFIMLAKDKNSKSALEELRPYFPLMAIVLLITAAGVYYFSRKTPITGM
ncbi:MAG: SCO family protein [Chitinophagales bacterium]